MELRAESKVSLGFKGTGFQALGWGFIAILPYLLIIPAAWGAVALYRWFFRNLVFSDGTQASFEGRGGQVWFYFVIVAVLGFLPQLSQAFHEDQQLVVTIAILILYMPISIAIWSKSFSIAKIYGGFRDYKRALKRIESINKPEQWLNLNTWDWLAPVRNDPLYKELLRRINLEP